MAQNTSKRFYPAVLPNEISDIYAYYAFLSSLFSTAQTRKLSLSQAKHDYKVSKKNVDDQKSVRKKKKRPLVAPIFNHADVLYFNNFACTNLVLSALCLKIT